MKILWSNEVWEWYKNNKVDEDLELDGIRMDKPVIPKYKNIEQLEFNTKGNAKHLDMVAEKLLSGLSGWNECLVVLTQWGVWPSAEDWPRFYSWRGKNGSKISLSEAPGHLFALYDINELKELLTQVFEFGWEGYMLLSSKLTIVDAMVFISQEGWLEVNSDSDFNLKH